MSEDANRAIRKIQMEARKGSVIEGKIAINWKYIKENCLKIAEEFLSETHQSGIPISLKQICELRRIRLIKSTLPAANVMKQFDFQGEIIPNSDGFVVNLNSNHSVIRNRATLAHEIGHSLFYDTSKSPPKKVYKNNDSEEEWVCWDFARSLLIPRLHVEELLSQYKETPKPQLISEIANNFKVSIDILLKRIRWDFNSWKDSTLFVGSFKGGKFTVNKDNIHKGRSDNNITIVGKNGLIYNNPLKTYISFLSISPDTNFLDNKINDSLRVELLRFNKNPISILGIIRSSR